jgi:hypothetical protein
MEGWDQKKLWMETMKIEKFQVGAEIIFRANGS